MGPGTTKEKGLNKTKGDIRCQEISREIGEKSTQRSRRILGLFLRREKMGLYKEGEFQRGWQ